VALFAVGALSVLGYSLLTRDVPAHAAPPEPAPRTHAQAPQTPPPTQSRATRADNPPPPAPVESSAPQPPTVAKLAADTTSADARTRAAAIEALGQAPRSEAIPALERVLANGDETDQTLALHSLHTLVQRQGDGDQQIRNIVRKIVYHGSEEALTLAAQTTLNDIERDVSDAAAARRLQK
jgi:HEAT repeat protein